jgi:hypothetical protein
MMWPVSTWQVANFGTSGEVLDYTTCPCGLASLERLLMHKLERIVQRDISILFWGVRGLGMTTQTRPEGERLSSQDVSDSADWIVWLHAAGMVIVFGAVLLGLYLLA